MSLAFSFASGMAVGLAIRRSYSVRTSPSYLFFFSTRGRSGWGTKKTRADLESRISEFCKEEESKNPEDETQVLVKSLAGNVAERDADAFDVLGEFRRFLKTEYLGRTGFYAPVLPSSQTLLYESFDGVLQEGLICIVDRQSKGKGRGGNSWVSPQGSAMCSFKFQETSGRKVPFLQYLIALAVHRAIKSLPGGEHIDVGIKWPNDIYVDKKIKIGGVLSQSKFSDNKFDVTIGMGINTTNEEPTVSLNSKLPKGFPRISREQLLAEVLNQFESMMPTFRKEGFKPFHEDYKRAWLHTDQNVQVCLKDGKDPIMVQIKGICEASAGLYAIDKNNKPYELYPDGNSFDFFKGLIRRKL